MAWAEKRGPWYRVRYRDSNGVVQTNPGKYATKKEASDAAKGIDTDTNRGAFIDPRAARTSLHDWTTQWRAVHRVSPGTKAKYDQYLDNHILPAFGKDSLDEIRRSMVKDWAGGLSGRYAEARFFRRAIGAQGTMIPEMRNPIPMAAKRPVTPESDL